LNFLDGVLKNPQISYFMNICPVGDELLHAKGETADGRQTDRRDKADGHFSQFYEPAKKTKLNKLFQVNRYPSPGWIANPQSQWSSGRTL
jgi:hypothetical protein